MLQQALTPAGSHFSPLEKLNDDCLLLIFQEVRPQITFIANTSPREVRSCNIALLELRRVCKSWKELVESRPELWSTIFVFTRSLRSINSALVYLHRSRQTPLYLYVFGGLSDTPSDETGIAKNFKRGLQVAATRVIHLKLFDPDSELMGIWTAAPRLQELIIFGVVDTTTCFRGDTSNLELMVAPLSTFSTLRSNSTLQKLTNLTIYQSNGRYTARHLAGILGCTPQLRILKLKNMAIESTPSETTHTVSLPLLERLELFGCDRKVAELTELPLQSSISVSFPEFLNDCLVPGFVERVGVTYLPLSFLKSTTLSINVFAGENGRTNVKLNGHWAADGFHSNIHIQLGRGSQLTTRFASCLLACGIVRNLRSVVNLNIHVSIARLPMRLTQWLAGPPNLQNLKITGKYMSQVVRDLLHLDSGSLQSLQSIILERNISTPVVEALEGWLASREQMGVPVQRVFIPTNVDALSARVTSPVSFCRLPCSAFITREMRRSSATLVAPSEGKKPFSTYLYHLYTPMVLSYACLSFKCYNGPTFVSRDRRWLPS